jgi:GNAT superfamily N-acetyltransferase
MTRRRPSLDILTSADGWTLAFEHAFRAFHDKVYVRAFPDADIRDSAANIRRVSDTRLFGAREPRGFVDLAMARPGALSRKVDPGVLKESATTRESRAFFRPGRGGKCFGTPAGGIVYDLFRSSDAALISYIAVAEGWRGKGVASLLMDGARQTLEAERLAAGRPLMVFAETEKHTESDDDRTRLNALGRLGFAALDCDYVQPPLGPGKQHVPLTLLVHRPAGETVPAPRVERFLRGFYRSLLGDGLASDAVSQGVLAAIAARDVIAVKPLRAG